VPHHVLLVPGFFGFANLGDFAYFAHVRDLLAELGPDLGLDGEIRVVKTAPTATLSRRAALLVEAIDELLDRAGGEVSIVGHSSGGLDARLVVSPEVSLPTDVNVERCARAVRSVVTVSAPHYGTPVAHFFNNLLGQQLLRILSLATIYSIRAGRLPIGAVLRLAGLFRRPRAAPTGVVDQLFGQLLADFSREPRQRLERFFESLGQDQDLVGQITPAGMDVYNASTDDRPGIRYGCVVTQARRPGLRSALGAGLSPYAQATHALYVGLYRVASGTPRKKEPPLTLEQATPLRLAYGRLPDARSNDGMVPTRSQVWGEVIRAVWADHLDVIGHFNLPTHVPPHFDWLTSGTGFTRAQFEELWGSVAAYLATGVTRRPRPAAVHCSGGVARARRAGYERRGGLPGLPPSRSPCPTCSSS
jgi:triacylglycerol lipase